MRPERQRSLLSDERSRGNGKGARRWRAPFPFLSVPPDAAALLTVRGEARQHMALAVKLQTYISAYAVSLPEVTVTVQ